MLGITNNRRVSAEIAPMRVGLMPGPGVVVIGGAMVKSISHIRLILSSAYFMVEVASLIKGTVPIITVFCIVLFFHYLPLSQGLPIFHE